MTAFTPEQLIDDQVINQAGAMPTTQAVDNAFQPAVVEPATNFLNPDGPVAELPTFRTVINTPTKPGGIRDVYLGSDEAEVFELREFNQFSNPINRTVVLAKGGDDMVHGTSVMDQVSGGDGHDTVFGQLGDDQLQGGHGNDMLYGQQGKDGIYGDHGNDYIDGGEGDDYLDGGTGNDLMFGGNGYDRMWGRDGHDEMFGGDGNDAMEGGQGNDWLWGDRGDDHVQGNDGHDHLWGDRGRDILSGGNGQDVLDGGIGDDTLTGGNGSDTFVLSQGVDVITDFNHFQLDKISLSNFAGNVRVQEVIDTNEVQILYFDGINNNVTTIENVTGGQIFQSFVHAEDSNIIALNFTVPQSGSADSAFTDSESQDLISSMIVTDSPAF